MNEKGVIDDSRNFSVPLPQWNRCAQYSIHRGKGGWHLIENFFRPRPAQPRLFVSGIGCETDTTPLLSNRGIFECSARLSEWQIPHPPGAVYAADHARAIADM